MKIPPRYHNSDCDFAQALSLRAKISKFGASIRSCTISPSTDSPLFEEPTITTLDDLEYLIEAVVEPDKIGQLKSVIAAINVGKPKGPTPEFLLKLWLVTEKLAENAIHSNTQLYHHNSDNKMSRQFSMNDRMSRYHRLNNVFFSDTMLATPKAKW